jgi:HK97 family phage prohead protease
MHTDSERRFAATTFEVRNTTNGGGKTIVGIAARYNVLSTLMVNKYGSSVGEKRATPYVFERNLRGAFEQSANNRDVACLYDHDASKVLGRTTAGTLALRDTPQGLAFTCSLPNTQTANDLAESIRRGDINSCSYGFTMTDVDEAQDCVFTDLTDDDIDECMKNYDGQLPIPADRLREMCSVRNVRAVRKLYEMSVVTFPAFRNGTSVAVRSEGAGEPVILTPTDEQIAAETSRFVETVSADVRARRRDLLNSIL